MAGETRKLYAFAHTHWDREWYQPFEVFRAHLLSLVRYLLPKLANGSMPRFYMDGQSVILEDVVAIEPEVGETIRRLMAEGKLAAGPWYVLPDEMLVSGESLIRNLDVGLQTARAFGEPALVGYCPDTFGHSQDLPAVLAGFGIKNAIVWRGVPLLEMGPLFWWRSPDGARVLAYHLTRGYYQTGFHELAPVVSDVTAVASFVAELKSWVALSSGTTGGASPYYKAIDGALFPIGADHVAPPGNLQGVIAKVNEVARKQKAGFEIVPTTLAEFMQMVASKAAGVGKIVQAVDGELRFNRAAPFYERAYLLPGVLSTRLYLKRANRLAEWRLARVVGPLRALADVVLGNFGGGGEGRSNSRSSLAELGYAWKLLLKNHPHDSICGCSVDAVHDEMMTRTRKLSDVLDAVVDGIESDLCRAPHNYLHKSHRDPGLKQDRLAVFNVSDRAVRAPVFLKWYQPVGSGVASNTNIQIVSKERADQLFSGWGAVPYYEVVDAYEGWVWPSEVPAMGYKNLDWPITPSSDAGVTPLVSCAANRISNGVLTVTVSSSGRLTVSHAVPGAGGGTNTYRLNHTIRDVGDGGDTYNFDPIPDDKPIEAKFVSAEPRLKGPLVASLLLRYEIDIPEAAVADTNILKRAATNVDMEKIEIMRRSRKKIRHEIAVELTLKRGVPVVFFDVEWDNRAADHRMEVVLDTGSQVKVSYSENHLSIARREHSVRAKERLPVAVAHESFPDRFPMQRFVVANGQAIFNTGMPEYAVEGSGIAMTMLRAVSYLSRPRLWTRGGGAGPNVKVPAGNCFGVNRCSYAWAPLTVPFAEIKATGNTDQWVQEAYTLAASYEGSLFASLGVGPLREFESQSLIALSNTNTVISSFFRRSGDSLILRVQNVTNTPQKTQITFAFPLRDVQLCNFAGEVQSKCEIKSAAGIKRVEIILDPYKVQSVLVSC